MAIVLGVQLGILLFFMVGPVFVLIMDETIKNGKKSALALALGMWAGDFIYAILAFYGISTFFQSYDQIDVRWGYILAGGLIILGIQSIRSRRENIFSNKIKTKNTKSIFTKGFFINIFNPFVIIFWTAIATQISSKSEHFILLFYISLFSTVVAGDIFKIFAAHFFIKRLKTSNLTILRLLLGILLVVIGVIMILRISTQIL